MPLSSLELAKARESAKTILEELHLDAYIYEVEPRDGTWELKIECACDINGGWESVVIQVPKWMLLDGLEDEEIKPSLLEFWKKKLVGCKLSKPGRVEAGDI